MSDWFAHAWGFLWTIYQDFWGKDAFFMENETQSTLSISNCNKIEHFDNCVCGVKQSKKYKFVQVERLKIVPTEIHFHLFCSRDRHIDNNQRINFKC